jgi:bifunctional DNase/RNase
MYKPVKLITKIPYQDYSTYYLFNKADKVLIPVEIDKRTQSSAVPSIYSTLRRVVKALGYSFLYTRIYKQSQGVFYTYLSLGKSKGGCNRLDMLDTKLSDTNDTLDINISFRDGIELAKETNTPIYIKEEIIKEMGIEVTKELVEKALAS